MHQFLVIHITGDNVIDYGTYSKEIGIYSTASKARKARANYAKSEELVEDGDEYRDMLKSHKSIYYLHYGRIQITKIELDCNQYLKSPKEQS